MLHAERKGFSDAASQQKKRKSNIDAHAAKRVLKIFKPYKMQVALILVILLVTSLLGVVTPLLVRAILDDAILNHNTAHLFLYAAIGLAVAIVGGLMSILQTYLNSIRIASRKIFLFLHFNSHFHPFCSSVLNEARPLSNHPQLKRNGCAILFIITTIFREANKGDVSVVATSGFCARWFLRRHVWQQD